MAEREGFEPSIRFPVYTRSRRAPSTTRPPLHMRRDRLSGKDDAAHLVDLAPDAKPSFTLPSCEAADATVPASSARGERGCRSARGGHLPVPRRARSMCSQPRIPSLGCQREPAGSTTEGRRRETAKPGAEQDVPWSLQSPIRTAAHAQRWRKFGVRFSTKAVMPSLWSSSANMEWKTRRS